MAVCCTDKIQLTAGLYPDYFTMCPVLAYTILSQFLGFASTINNSHHFLILEEISFQYWIYHQKKLFYISLHNENKQNKVIEK